MNDKELKEKIVALVDAVGINYWDKYGDKEFHAYKMPKEEKAFIDKSNNKLAKDILKLVRNNK